MFSEVLPQTRKDSSMHQDEQNIQGNLGVGGKLYLLREILGNVQSETGGK